MGRRNEHRRNKPGRGYAERKRAKSAEPREPQVLDEATGLPAHLVEAVRAAYAPEHAGLIVAGWGAAATRRTTLRANTLLASRDELASALDAAGIGWDPVPWYGDAFVLAEGTSERDVWALGAYQEGKLYLQSLSSMLPPLALVPAAGADILDMCAAPGGKTSQMAALAAGDENTRAAHITACEFSQPRAEKLEHNLAKLGATNVQVMRTDARKLDEWFSFDQILLDAPCTGSGIVRTHDERAARNLTSALADGVERSQRALIDKALQVLKPGGTLVYSTCSVLPRENEDIVSWALAKHRTCTLEPLALPGAGGETFAPPLLSCKLEGACTVCPSELFEGFFVAKIRKGEGA